MKKKKGKALQLYFSLNYYNKNFNKKSKTSMKTKQKRNGNEKETKQGKNDIKEKHKKTGMVPCSVTKKSTL